MKSMDNILVIDNAEETISYKKSDIDNKIDIESLYKKFCSYIKASIEYLIVFESNRFLEACEKAKILHDNFGFKFDKCSDTFYLPFHDLLSLFAKRDINDKLINVWLEMFDFSNIVTIINKDGIEKSINELVTDPILLKITDTDLIKENNEIYIGLNFDNPEHIFYMDEKIWQSSTYYNALTKCPLNSREVAGHDYNGYQNTQEIINAANDNPAAEYCIGLNINNGSSIYQGYLPSVGQLEKIRKWMEFLNYILINNYRQKFDPLRWNVWSSSERNDTQAWVHGYFGINEQLKDNEYIILPLFKKIK